MYQFMLDSLLLKYNAFKFNLLSFRRKVILSALLYIDIQQ